MPSGSTLGIFALAAVALVVVPGPSVLYIVTQSVERGARTGVVAALGIESGTFVHTLAAALGISALVVSSATAFSVVKYGGAAYLIYLGLRELLRRDGTAAEERGEGLAPTSTRRVFWQGVLVQVLNPKTAVFALAFFPQFVDPDRGPVALQIVVLGTLLALIGLLSDMVWCLLGGAAGRRLKASLQGRLRRWVAGPTFVALGIGTALSAVRRSPS